MPTFFAAHQAAPNEAFAHSRYFSKTNSFNGDSKSCEIPRKEKWDIMEVRQSVQVFTVAATVSNDSVNLYDRDVGGGPENRQENRLWKSAFRYNERHPFHDFGIRIVFICDFGRTNKRLFLETIVYGLGIRLRKLGIRNGFVFEDWWHVLHQMF